MANIAYGSTIYADVIFSYFTKGNGIEVDAAPEMTVNKDTDDITLTEEMSSEDTLVSEYPLYNPITNPCALKKVLDLSNGTTSECASAYTEKLYKSYIERVPELTVSMWVRVDPTNGLPETYYYHIFKIFGLDIYIDCFGNYRIKDQNSNNMLKKTTYVVRADSTDEVSNWFNKWHHIALTCDGFQFNFFVDGRKRAVIPVDVYVENLVNYSIHAIFRNEPNTQADFLFNDILVLFGICLWKDDFKLPKDFLYKEFDIVDNLEKYLPEPKKLNFDFDTRRNVDTNIIVDFDTQRSIEGIIHTEFDTALRIAKVKQSISDTKKIVSNTRTLGFDTRREVTTNTTVEQDTVRVITQPGAMIVDIPFPYRQFIDTEFFLTDATNDIQLLIPDDHWKRIGEYQIWITNPSDFDITTDSDIRFTFCHNKNRYHISKVEYHMICETDGQFEFDIPDSPHNISMNLNHRFHVWYNRKEITQTKQFNIDSKFGKLYIEQTWKTCQAGDRIDIVCFYTGVKIDDITNHAIQKLPMSGYIYLKRHMIDRNYDNNLMAVFVNGELIPRDKIIEMSNNVYKIKEDIHMRYNLDVRNMSPRIASLVPFYKKAAYNIEAPRQVWFHDLVSTITVGNITPKGRKFFNTLLNPVYFDPSILENPNLWISLIHIGKEHSKSKKHFPNLDYSVSFYENDYKEDNETTNLQIIVELREKANEGSKEAQSYTSILLGEVPSTLTEIDDDYCIASTQIKNILSIDTYNRTRYPDQYGNINRALDGIVGRLQVPMFRKPLPEPIIYYDLTSNMFTTEDKVGVLEWVISTGRDGTGERLWVKHIDLEPSNHISSIYDENVEE